MYELITTLIILGLVIFIIRSAFWSYIPRNYITWFGFVVLILAIAVVFIEPSNRIAGVLWGILSFPLRPLGLVMLLLAYALSFVPAIYLFGRAKLLSIPRPQVLAAFLILLISSLPLTSYLLTAQSEQRIALELLQRPAGATQAIVVLGDGTIPTDPSYRMRTKLSNAVNGLSISLESRLNYAVQLYNEQVSQGTKPLIVVSAGPQAILAREGTTATDAINAFLGRLGIPAEQIQVDTKGYDPRSSAVAVRRILLGPGAVPECVIYAVCDNGSVDEVEPRSRLATTEVPIILVTPAVTVRRAVSTFTDLYFKVTPRPTDFFVFQIQAGASLAVLSDLLPSADALAITTRVIDEYWAWIYYFMRGWLTDPLSV